MGSQQFCLRWNNHQTNMLSVFDKLLTKEAFVDVTIACEGSSIKAHKMVLSACSPFFEELFCDNPCKHPIVILRDMKHSDLQAIIEFMYKGEINVSQDRLSGLLKTAESLKVKGLAEVTHDDHGVAKSIESNSNLMQEIQYPHVATSNINHTSSSNKRKSKPHRNGGDIGELNVCQPLAKKRPESPKVSDIMRGKQPSSPKINDMNANLSPNHSDELHAIPVGSSQIASKVQTPQAMSPNLPVGVNSKEGLKVESPSPPPEIISAEPISNQNTSNQEFILEPETVMDHGIMGNKSSSSVKSEEPLEQMNMGPNTSMAVENFREQGHSVDQGFYSDGAKKTGVNQVSVSIGPNQFRSRHNKSWSEEDMRQAITMIITGGWDIRRTAETYNIPLRTLYYHLKKAREDKSLIVHPASLNRRCNPVPALQ